MEQAIEISAGGNIYEKIRDGMFTFDDVSGVVGPAVGPRWFLAAGFDLALMRAGVLGRKYPVTLAGASAGALRFGAWVQPEPERVYRRLVDSYSSLSFTGRDTPATIQQALADVIDEYIEDDAVPFALANRRYRLAFTVARARHLLRSDIGLFQLPALVMAGLCNIVSPGALSLFFQRVVFYSGYQPPAFCRRPEFRGLTIPLDQANFKRVLLASSAVPLRVAGVKNIFGAPRGLYRDGGLVDYHCNQYHGGDGDGVVLMFHHQKDIVPTWLDGRLIHRTLPPSWTDNVLLITPTPSFVASLPGGKIPDRTDFTTFAGNPDERVKRWRRVIELSMPLGGAFLDLVAGGGIRNVVQRL